MTPAATLPYVAPNSPTTGSVRPEGGEALALYTPEQRRRRDASPLTLVQGILAPLQVVVMLGSAYLILRTLWSGSGYELATASILLKTLLLYLIMITGALWEKEVFGMYLFAPAFFWEDVVSMGVMALHTAYLVALFLGLLSPVALLLLALVAYDTYAANALQFVLKLRTARLEARTPPHEVGVVA